LEAPFAFAPCLASASFISTSRAPPAAGDLDRDLDAELLDPLLLVLRLPLLLPRAQEKQFSFPDRCSWIKQSVPTSRYLEPLEPLVPEPLLEGDLAIFLVPSLTAPLDYRLLMLRANLAMVTERVCMMID
jgi:hypothetical protein